MRSPVELGDDRWISVESTLGHNLDLIVHEAVTNEDMGASCMLHLHATRPGDERFLRSVQWAMGNVKGRCAWKQLSQSGGHWAGILIARMVEL